MNLTEIENLTRGYARARNDLHMLVQSLNDEMEILKRKALPLIKAHVGRAAERHGQLQNALTLSPHLFEKPRTVVFHEIKVGFRKGSGGIDWDDDEKVAALIEKHFPKAQAELLIKVVKKPIAKALEDLDVGDLKAIGCRVEKTGDVPVIKPVDTAVDKIVNALLKDALAETQDAG